MIGVLNAGSSSIKFAAYATDDGLSLRHRGLIEKIGIAPRLSVFDGSGKKLISREWAAGQLDHAGATREILAVGHELSNGTPVQAIGHRVVHGGMKYAAPVVIDDRVVADLKQLIPLAPLHQPHNLAPIEAIAQEAPGLPQVACFDTAFHRSQPVLAQSFALPHELMEEGIRRYGFHGLSYEYISTRLGDFDKTLATSRVIAAHLGNGASLCAMQAGRSVASTMGFTAVDGLMMGTRCGAIDPGVILYLMQERGMDAKAIETLIYNKSGLLGVSGISSDMRTLRQRADEPAARRAVDLFVYRIVREIGSMAAALGGVDALVFTAGIGENDADTRAAVLRQCAWLGVELDEVANAQGSARISRTGSRASAWVVPTDEERMIARHSVDVLGRLAKRGRSEGERQ